MALFRFCCCLPLVDEVSPSSDEDGEAGGLSSETCERQTLCNFTFKTSKRNVEKIKIPYWYLILRVFNLTLFAIVKKIKYPRKIPKISPSMYKPPKPVTQKTLR